MTILSKFERELHLVDRLMPRVGVQVDGYDDPMRMYGRETGADVLARAGGLAIGIQHTELDTGAVRGRARALEKGEMTASFRDGHATYGSWGSNSPIGGITRTIEGKVERACRYDFGEFDEIWLVVSGNIPEMGSVISTFAFAPHISLEMLNAATHIRLAASKYRHVFLNLIVGGVVYHWQRPRGWQVAYRE